MSPQTIAIADIDASERLRPLDPNTVAAYAAIAEQRIGEGKSPLVQPIIVRPVGEAYELVTGGHRLACLADISFETLTIGLEVIVKEMGLDAAFEDEVFENLANAGLNALDRAIFLAQAKKVADAKRGEARGRKSKADKLQGHKIMADSAIISSARFTKEAAARIGLSETQVKEAVRIANALDPQAIVEIRGTMIEDNIVELKQLVELAPDQQRKAALAIKSGAAKKVSEARVAIGLEDRKNDDPQARFYASAIDVWGKLDKLHRANFLDALGVPRDVAKKIVGNEARQGEVA